MTHLALRLALVGALASLFFACSSTRTSASDSGPPDGVARDLAPDDHSAHADGAGSKLEASIGDLPAWTDGGDAGTSLDGPPRFDAPVVTDPANDKPIAEQSAEQLLWHLQSGGAGKVAVLDAWPAADGRLALLLRTEGEVTLAGETLAKAGSSALLRLLTLDGDGVAKHLVLSTDAGSAGVASIADGLAMLLRSSEPITLLPESPAPMTIPAPSSGQHHIALRVGWDGSLSWARRLDGVADRIQLRTRDKGTSVALFGTYDTELAMEGKLILARKSPPPKGSYWGSGFVVLLDGAGTLTQTAAIDGQATSGFHDVALRDDGGFYACGVVGGYSGTGVNLGTFNHGEPDEIVFAGYSDDDPSATPFLGRFDAQGRALWVRAAHARAEFFSASACELTQASPKHIRMALKGYQPVAFSGGVNLLITGPAPVVLYQEDGAPVLGATFAISASGWAVGMVLQSPARWLTGATETLRFDPYGALPRALVLPSTVGQGNAAMHVVADVDAAGQLTAIRWGLRPAVAQGSIPQHRFVPLSTDIGVVVGTSYQPVTFGGGSLEVAADSMAQLFVVASKLARGTL